MAYRKQIMGVLFAMGLALWGMGASGPQSGAALAQGANSDFPFGTELTLVATPMRGSKRLPTLEIGDSGQVAIELWCKGARGQFSVAGNTIILVPGPLEDRGCPADRAQADDALYARLAAVATWSRQGDMLVLTGEGSLRYRLNTN